MKEQLICNGVLQDRSLLMCEQLTANTGASPVRRSTGTKHFHGPNSKKNSCDLLISGYYMILMIYAIMSAQYSRQGLCLKVLTLYRYIFMK